MMERALKERIIGAAVLVLFVVLVVPVFLDGPPSDTELVSEPLLLPGQDRQKTQTVVLDRDRTDPVPSTTNEAAGPEKTPVKQSPPAQVKSAPVVKDEPPADDEKSPDASASTAVSTPVLASRSSTTGMWAVQLGSFSNKDNADKLAADLRKQGYAAFLSQLKTDSGQLHRVRIGPQKDRESAEAMAERLVKVGHKGQVVPHP